MTNRHPGVRAPTQPIHLLGIWPGDDAHMDFSEFETARGGIWRICAVIDYATKYCLAATVTRRLAARMRSAASAGPLSRPNGSSRRGRLLGQVR
jgi:hypothetical protein